MITITTSTNGISVDFNGYFTSGKTHTKMGYWSKRSISRVLNHDSYIEVVALDDAWLINLDGSDDLFGVGSVDAQAPSSIDDLHAKLVSALA